MWSGQGTSNADPAKAGLEGSAAGVEGQAIAPEISAIAVPETPNLTYCPRCQGRMFPGGIDGDAACFSCGHVAYAAVLPTITESKRRPSHGGRSLS
jgi:hypothetical protein